MFTFAASKRGIVAQSVEQWTENPCVAGSIPADTTEKNRLLPVFFMLIFFVSALKDNYLEGLKHYAVIIIFMFPVLLFDLKWIMYTPFLHSFNFSVSF
ncbi:MAG: hypothetical protein FD170_373 [Bacteroidetes bacterium]|nr:MAG: hypothetical protein FD170_373 [Bacteroidota bacterium]